MTTSQFKSCSLHARGALLVVILSLAACERKVESTATDLAASSENVVGNTIEYNWYAGDVPAGHTTITRTGDGLISSELFVHWNNREYKLSSRVQIDGNGMIDLESEEVGNFIALLKERDIVIDPTAAIFDSMMRHVAGEPDPTFAAIADHLPLSERRALFNPSFDIGEDRMEAWAKTAIRQREMIRKLHDSGIRLVAGSDGMAAFTVHRELETYAEADISNADILRIATLGAATVVGVDKETGSIEVGKVSDLVLLDGNPLDNISAVRRGRLVIKGNTIYKPNELYRAVGVTPFLDDK